MEYQDYIKLGFNRFNHEDNVAFNQTGHHPFHLEKKIKKGLFINVECNELDEPRLYIKKHCDQNTFHIIKISPETAISLLTVLQDE